MSEPQSRIVKLKTGLNYHLLEWGRDRRDHNHTVILVHGFLDLAWGWLPMARSGFSEGLHVVAPDMRGHGDSDWVGPGGYYHFMDYLADMRALVDLLARDHLSLVGHSMGGSIVSYFAGTYPDEVGKLALLEGLGPPESMTPMPERVAGWLRGWTRARTAGSRAIASLEDAAERLKRHDPLLQDELARELAAKGTTQTAAGTLRFKHDPLHLTVGPYPFSVDTAASFWRRIACPVLLVDGDKSLFRHPAQETARRQQCFANVRHTTLRGAAHMMQRHQPAALAETLRRFLVES